MSVTSQTERVLINSTTAAVVGGTWHTHNPRPAANRADRSFKNYFAKKAYTGSGSWSSIG